MQSNVSRLLVELSETRIGLLTYRLDTVFTYSLFEHSGSEHHT